MSKEIRCFPHLSALFSSLWYPPPSPCFTQPPTPQRREKGRLIDVEGCSGPTAINSSPPRSSLSCWWNLCSTAARHRIQEGLQTNASSVFALLFCLQSGPLWQTPAETTSASVPSFLQWLAALEYRVRRIEEVKRLEGSWSYKRAEQLFSPSLTSRWRPGVTCWDTTKPVPVERLQSVLQKVSVSWAHSTPLITFRCHHYWCPGCSDPLWQSKPM